MNTDYSYCSGVTCSIRKSCKRLFGADELDAELCIKDGMNYQIAEIHLGVMWKAQIFFVKRSQGVGMSMKNGTNAKRTRKTCHQLEHIAF